MAKSKKLDLIEELTTHKNDFKFWPLYQTVVRKDFRSREEEPKKPSPPYVSSDPQTFAPYSPSIKVPFDLYLAPKPILGVDPRECIDSKKQSRSKNTIMNHITTNISPAIPLDEVMSQQDLDTILTYTYSQLDKKILEEAALNTSQKPKPPNRVTEPQNIFFKPELYPPLPPGWVAACKHWDCLQSRSLGDPQRKFWERRGPEIECGCCCNPLPNLIDKETKQEIRRLIDEDKLSLAYNTTIKGYSGYRQICAKGVSLEKK